MKRILCIMAMLALPCGAMATPDLVVADADATQPVKRFMPLDSVRAGTAGLRIAPRTALPSDKSLMQNGFLKIDRARDRPIPLQHALVKTPTITDAARAASPMIIRGAGETKTPEPVQLASVAPNEPAAILPDSEELSPENVNPVLNLFNGDGTSELASFRDALGGKSIPMKGNHAWPLPSNVAQRFSSGFGVRANPFNPQQREFHNGIDISAEVGTAVLASADGAVIRVGNDARYGKFIELQHADGTQTQYGHLSNQTVREGQRVGKGEVIGAVGSTGRSTGAHLDFRISKNGTKLDPMGVLRPPMGVYASNGSTVSAPKLAAVTTLPKRPLTPGMMKVISVR